jgi:hypothetical protein
MKERPILFSDPMVRAILEGRKTQTRRIIKNVPFLTEEFLPCDEEGEFLAHPNSINPEYNSNAPVIRCPYGFSGDRLWVRETWAASTAFDSVSPLDIDGEYIWYKAGGMLGHTADESLRGRWRPSIHMPRMYSRITLEIVGVRVERLRDISEEDAEAEGVEIIEAFEPYRGVYRMLWESIHGGDSWDANPWVWVIEFRRITRC